VRGNGIIETIDRGLYEGRESFVEGGDSDDEACDGDSDGSEDMPWPSELLHRPRRDRRKPMSTPSAQQNSVASHGGLGEGVTGIANARRGEDRNAGMRSGWESCGEGDDNPEGS
jgi:hypothetical protein